MIEVEKNKEVVMFNKLSKSLIVFLSFIYASSVLGADLLGSKRYGSQDIRNHVSAKVIKANQVSISSGFSYVSEPNISLIDGTYNTLKMDNASVFDGIVGYGIADIVELDLGIHFSYEKMDKDIREILVDRGDERAQESLASTLPKDFDFSGVSALLKIQVLDFKYYKLALSGVVESAAKDNAVYTITRSSKLSGGWILSNEVDFGRFVELGINVGDIYTTSQQVGDYKVGDRIFVQSLLNVKPTDMFSIFVGSEYKHIKLNSKYSLTADAYTGLKISGQNLGFTLFAGKQLSDACLSYGPFSFGLSLTYTSNPILYASADDQDDEIIESSPVAAEKKVKKANRKQSLKPRLVASSNKDDLRFTQKDGVYYDDDGNVIDVQGSLKNEFKDDRDEFYDFDRKIQASRQGDVVDPAVVTERYYQEELAKARAERELKEKQEVRKQQLAEIERKKALKKQVEEEDRLERKYRNKKFKELEDLPEITDDEINWNGLR